MPIACPSDGGGNKAGWGWDGEGGGRGGVAAIEFLHCTRTRRLNRAPPAAINVINEGLVGLVFGLDRIALCRWPHRRIYMPDVCLGNSPSRHTG